MSQSDKSNINKNNKPKVVGEGSEPSSGRPSADPTEEVVSAVNQYFGIGHDSTIDVPKKVGSDSKTVNEIPTSNRSVTQNPTLTITENDTGVRTIPETSKSPDSKTSPSPVSSRSARDLNSGRILAKTNSERPVEQKLQSSNRSSLEQTESEISAVTQYFGIGQDDNTSQSTTGANVRKEQIIAASQVASHQDSSVTTKKPIGGSKVPDSKVPSTVIAKQKSSPETSSAKVESDSVPNKIYAPQLAGGSSDRGESQQRSSQKGSERPSNEPTESVISAIKQQFGIGQQDSILVSKKMTSEGNERTIATAQNVAVNHESDPSETRKQGSESKTTDTKVPPTHTAKQKLTSESNTKNENAASESMVQSSSGKPSRSVDGTNNNGLNDSRKLKENGDVGSKRVSIVTGSMTMESVLAVVTDTFGISHSTQSELERKSKEPLATASSRKQEGETRSLGPIEQNDTNVTPNTKATPDHVGKAQPDYPIPMSEKETPSMINNDKVRSSRSPESKVPPYSEVSAKPTPIVVASQTPMPRNKLTEIPQIMDDKKQPVTNTAAVSGNLPSPATGTPPILQASNGKGSQEVHPSSMETRSSVAAKVVESPRTMDDQRPYAAKALDSTVSPSPAVLATSTPGVVTDQDSKKGGGAPATTSDRVKATSHHEVSASKVPPTPETISEHRRNDVTDKAENQRSSDARKQHTGGRSLEPYGSPSQSVEETTAPIVAGQSPISESQTVAANKPETPRTKDDIKTVNAMSPSTPTTAANVSPLVINAQGAGIDNEKSSNNTLKDRRPVKTENTRPSIVPPTSAEVPQQTQSVKKNGMETQRTLEEHKLLGTTSTPKTATSSGTSPITAQLPVVVNAQDRRQDNTNRALSTDEPPPSIQSTKAPMGVATAGPTVVTGVPQQPQSVRINAAETLQTMEEHGPIETKTTMKPTTEAVSSSPAQPPPVAVNTQYRDGPSSTNVPPPPIQPKEPPKQAANAGSTAIPGVPQQPQSVRTNAAETLQTMEEHGPIEAKTTMKPTAEAVSSSPAQPPPVAVNTQYRAGASSTNVPPPPIQPKEPPKQAATAGSTAIPGVPQQPQSVRTNAAETLQTMEEHGPTEAKTTMKPTAEAVSSSPAQPVIVSAQDRRQRDMNSSPIRSADPEVGVTSAASRAAPATSVPVPIRGSHTSTVTARQCWICFATDEDELGLAWIQPCKCKGTTKWVHQSCLQMWVDEKLREHREKKVACPQCRTEYLIYLPKANLLVRSLDQVDNVIYRVCPFIAAGVVIGSFYWNAVTYGAIVMLQVAGSEGASVVAETFQPTVIIVGLPFIPLSLIVFRLFQWEDSFLHILRTASHCIPLLHYLLPGHVVNETGTVTDVPAAAAMSFQRVLAGALLTPIIAKVFGNFFFSSITSPIWRTVFGGALFISVKGLVKMYHKQQTYKRLSRRKILDYTDANKRLIEQTRPVVNQVVPTPLRFQFVASVENRRNIRR